MSERSEDIASSLPVPPGETLRETLETMDLSQVELSRRMGRPVKTINEIVQGKAQITPDTAIQLERVLGVPAPIWNNLEIQYREALARGRAEEALKKEEAFLTEFPYAEMARHGWVPKTRVRRTQVEALLTFFSVASIRLVFESEQAAYRVGRRHGVSQGALAAWLRQGERTAEGIEAAPYDSGRVRAAIPGLRRLTRLAPADFEQQLVQDLAASGVAVVFIPHPKQTYANGAVRWLSKDRAVIQLSLRYRYADVFWFTFFHELGHLLLHGKRRFFVDTEATSADRLEYEADRFAASTLIRDNEYDPFVSRGDFTAPAIIAFADRIEVAPGIVVGRLQHDRLIPFSWHAALRTKFKWAG